MIKGYFKKAILSFTCALLLLSMSLGTLCVSANDPKANFIAAVEAISNAITLSEKADCLANAEAQLDAYVKAGGDIEAADIAPTVAIYNELKADIDVKVEYCELFIEYVELALTYSGESFVDMMTYIEKAEELIDKIDTSYVGVAGFKSDYTALLFEYEEPIDICERYIAYARLASEATTYGEASQNYTRAMECKSMITIPDYPGLDDAEADLAEASAFMARQLAAAQPFIDAVANISKAENVAKAIQDAFALIESENIDITAEGANVAYDELYTLKGRYERSVRDGNKAQDGAMDLIFSLLF